MTVPSCLEILRTTRHSREKKNDHLNSFNTHQTIWKMFGWKSGITTLEFFRTLAGFFFSSSYECVDPWKISLCFFLSLAIKLPLFLLFSNGVFLSGSRVASLFEQLEVCSISHPIPFTYQTTYRLTYTTTTFFFHKKYISTQNYIGTMNKSRVWDLST